MLNEDEEQSSDGLDNNSSDDEELFQPDENSEYDLDEDTLDCTSYMGSRFPSFAEMRESYKADFKAVEKLMAKRKWSLRHIVLLYTRFGGRPRGSRVSHTLPLSLILSSTERRFATRFYDMVRSYRLVEHPLPRFEALWCLVSGL